MVKESDQGGAMHVLYIYYTSLSVVSSTGRVRRAALHTYIPIYQRWIPVPLITADLFRRVVLSPVMRPRGRGFDSRSVTFPPWVLTW